MQPRLQKGVVEVDELRARVAAAGPRLPFVWQAQYTEPPGGAAARVAAAGGRLSCGLLEEFWAHHLSHTIFATRFLSHTAFTHYLSHPTLSRTILDTPLCHTPSFTHRFVAHHLSHTIFDTPSFTDHRSRTIFDTPSFTHHLSHTTLSHTIFDTPPFTHHFVTHHL